MITLNNAYSAKTVLDADVGLNLNFGVTWTKGASISSTLYCPANVACGLTAAAQFLHVEGMETVHNCGWDGSSDPNTYPCEYPPNPACSPGGNVNANVPTSFTAVFSLFADLFTILTFS